VNRICAGAPPVLSTDPRHPVLLRSFRRGTWKAEHVTRRGVQGFDGRMLRARRERAGLSVSELARRAEVAPQDVSKYESGTMKPGPGRLAALAECLGVKPLDLVDRSELGEGFKALRAAAGFTQAELVKRSGPDMTLSRLKSLELGSVRRLPHSDAAALAAALGTGVKDVRAAHQWDVDHASDTA
jgi:transcriptional regulator with XRE-family HTH domain